MSNGKRRNQPNPSFIAKGKDAAKRQQEQHVIIPLPIEDVRQAHFQPKYKIFHVLSNFEACKETKSLG
jgi:hypothetical protein